MTFTFKATIIYFQPTYNSYSPLSSVTEKYVLTLSSDSDILKEVILWFLRATEKLFPPAPHKSISAFLQSPPLLGKLQEWAEQLDFTHLMLSCHWTMRSLGHKLHFRSREEGEDSSYKYSHGQWLFLTVLITQILIHSNSCNSSKELQLSNLTNKLKTRSFQ